MGIYIKNREKHLLLPHVEKYFLAVIIPFLSLSGMISHNSHIFMYLNGLNLFIEYMELDFMNGSRK